jgi:hypothetical protein
LSGSVALVPSVPSAIQMEVGCTWRHQWTCAT